MRSRWGARSLSDHRRSPVPVAARTSYSVSRKPAGLSARLDDGLAAAARVPRGSPGNEPAAPASCGVPVGCVQTAGLWRVCCRCGSTCGQPCFTQSTQVSCRSERSGKSVEFFHGVVPIVAGHPAPHEFNELSAPPLCHQVLGHRMALRIEGHDIAGIFREAKHFIEGNSTIRGEELQQ